MKVWPLGNREGNGGQIRPVLEEIELSLQLFDFTPHATQFAFQFQRVFQYGRLLKVTEQPFLARFFVTQSGLKVRIRLP
jgi:hypothetical protein